MCTRVPLIIRVPKETVGLPKGTKAGSICSKPVNLLSLFPTLTALAGIDAKKDNNGPSLVPLLENPKGKWNHKSVTYLNHPGSYSIIGQRWRYIHYKEGDEELYDIETDRYEWTNLADEPEYASQLERMRSFAPKNFATFVPPKDSSLPKLEWQAKVKEAVPASKPDGNPFDVVFINNHASTVQLLWVDRLGKLKPYGDIGPGKRKRQKTRPGAVWMIADQSGKNMGYFVVGDRSARAIVP